MDTNSEKQTMISSYDYSVLRDLNIEPHSVHWFKYQTRAQNEEWLRQRNLTSPIPIGPIVITGCTGLMGPSGSVGPVGSNGIIDSTVSGIDTIGKFELPNVIHVQIEMPRFNVYESLEISKKEQQKNDRKFEACKKKIQNFVSWAKGLRYHIVQSCCDQQLFLRRFDPNKLPLVLKIKEKNEKRKKEYAELLRRLKRMQVIWDEENKQNRTKKSKEETNKIDRVESDSEEEQGQEPGEGQEEDDKKREEGEEDYNSDDDLAFYEGPKLKPYPSSVFITNIYEGVPYLEFLCSKGDAVYNYLVEMKLLHNSNRRFSIWNGEPFSSG